MKLYLGIIYKISDIDGELRPKSHRSVLKIIFNPLLRVIGFQINSIHDGSTVTGIEFMKIGKVYPNIIQNYKSSLIYNFDENKMVLVRKRIWF